MGRASWMPPVVWMIAMTVFSSPMGSAENTAGVIVPALRWLMPSATGPELESIHFLSRKVAHVLEYAVLAVLWMRALTTDLPRPRARAALAFVICVAWAALDETHQAFVPSRTGSPRDVAIDAVGAMAGLIAAGAGWRATLNGATGVLLWIAAVGGAALLVLDTAAGVGSGVLWATVPSAVLGLIARRRWRAGAGGPTP
ncbi:MAG TPA: VanZ family protein [Methylomirabilota bacterium]